MSVRLRLSVSLMLSVQVDAVDRLQLMEDLNAKLLLKEASAQELLLHL